MPYVSLNIFAAVAKPSGNSSKPFSECAANAQSSASRKSCSTLNTLLNEGSYFSPDQNTLHFSTPFIPRKYKCIDKERFSPENWIALQNEFYC